MKATKIQVFKDPMSEEVTQEFDNMNAFWKWAEKEGNGDNLNADCVAINDMIMYGWDEIEEWD